VLELAICDPATGLNVPVLCVDFQDMGTWFLDPTWWLTRLKVWVSGFDPVFGLILFFLNQNDVVLVKKQKSTGCNRVFDLVLPSQLGFFFPYFFFNPDWFQPRIGPPGRVLKLCMGSSH
jgi:hypothetical protein